MIDSLLSVRAEIVCSSRIPQIVNLDKYAVFQSVIINVVS